MSATMQSNLLVAERPSPTPMWVSSQRESVVDRVTLIISCFEDASPALTLVQLTDRTGLPKSTVHRIAEQLVDVRWLERTTQGYRLGLRFFELGGLVSRCTRLRERALPYLRDLQAATGQSVHLGMLEGVEVVIVEKVWGHGAHSLPTRVGGRMPAHCTASGRALLAFSDDVVVARVLDRGLDRHTGRTTIVPALLREQLETTRSTQWAMESEEYIVGQCCVAAPIRGAGRAIAAVSASGPVYAIEPERVAPLVRRCAANIWSQLFGHSRG